jgi:hypothetical protein
MVRDHFFDRVGVRVLKHAQRLGRHVVCCVRSSDEVEAMEVSVKKWSKAETKLELGMQAADLGNDYEGRTCLL